MFGRRRRRSRAGPVGRPRAAVHALGTRPPHRAARPAAAGPYDGAVRVSTRGDYACRALLSLALHADEGGPTSVRDIAERTGLPQPYLEQILLALKGAGLVRSKRGVGGGYVLARPPAEIRLGEIVSAVDGPIVARRLRRAAPGRRLRPRRPVRAARHLEGGRRADAPPARRLHPGRRRVRGPGRAARWPERSGVSPDADG